MDTLKDDKSLPEAESPEVTGEWLCPKCGNTSEFVGYDFEGYAGPDEDEGPVTLRQPFTVEPNGHVHYHSHTGGGYGAEIGDGYHRIRCQCGHVIWDDGTGDQDE